MKREEPTRAGPPPGEPFSLRVESYAGYRGEEEPRAFTLGRRRFAVLEILDRWLDPAHSYFKVRVEDGRRFVLRHDRGTGEWELAALVA